MSEATTQASTEASEDESTEETEGNEMADEQVTDLDKANAKLAKANHEAATLRKRLKDLEPLAKEAVSAREATKTEYQKLQDKHEALLVELAEANRAAIRERVARTAGLPDELAELLRGDSEEEMTEHAKRLVAVVAPRQVRRPDPSQGQDGGEHAALNGDPLLRDLKSKLHIP